MHDQVLDAPHPDYIFDAACFLRLMLIPQEVYVCVGIDRTERASRGSPLQGDARSSRGTH